MRTTGVEDNLQSKILQIWFKIYVLGVLTPKHYLHHRNQFIGRNTHYEPPCVTIGPSAWP